MGGAKDERRQRLARWAVPFLAATTLAFAASPAQAAGPGGASTLAASGTQVGSGMAFGPMRWAGATWYGPGLYGGHTACGQTLLPETIGVAHRSLPCGTTVKFAYHGRSIITQVIDRGPFSRGNSWDLTQAAARALGFEASGAGQLRFSVPLELAAEWHSAGHAGR